MENETRIAGIVLAAGESKRLGYPKQLVEFRGEPLVQRAANQLFVAGCDSVVTVLGANAEQIAHALVNIPTDVVVNDRWPEGLASSIQVGVTHVEQRASHVLILLCDQPLIETGHLTNLITTVQQTTCGIVASKYRNGSSGVPAAFARRFFAQLCSMTGDSGARTLLRELECVFLDVIGSHFDLDTEEDLRVLQNHA